jgi:hypothetical protein
MTERDASRIQGSVYGAMVLLHAKNIYVGGAYNRADVASEIIKVRKLKYEPTYTEAMFEAVKALREKGYISDAGACDRGIEEIMSFYAVKYGVSLDSIWSFNEILSRMIKYREYRDVVNVVEALACRDNTGFSIVPVNAEITGVDVLEPERARKLEQYFGVKSGGNMQWVIVFHLRRCSIEEVEESSPENNMRYCRDEHLAVRIVFVRGTNNFVVEVIPYGFIRDLLEEDENSGGVHEEIEDDSEEDSGEDDTYDPMKSLEETIERMLVEGVSREDFEEADMPEVFEEVDYEEDEETWFIEKLNEKLARGYTIEIENAIYEITQTSNEFVHSVRVNDTEIIDYQVVDNIVARIDSYNTTIWINKDDYRFHAIYKGPLALKLVNNTLYIVDDPAKLEELIGEDKKLEFFTLYPPS